MGHTPRAWIVAGVVALCVLPLAGCQRTRELPLPKPHPLKVRVTWQGQPVRFVIVNLGPVLPGPGAEADGCTGDDGTFEPRSFANDGSKDGLVPGKYEVTLEEYDPVRLVAIRPLPPEARPTRLPSLEWNTGVTVEFRQGDTELNVDIP